MTTMKQTGDRGECCAAEFLQSGGFRIVEQNFYSRFGEIDIIAENQQYILFVEVKTRVKGGLASPAAAVTPQKQRRILKTAEIYLLSHPGELQPRFDVIEVFTAPNGEVAGLNHLENAFWVGSAHR